MAASAATAGARTPLYFVNGPVDFLAAGGFSLLLWAVIASLQGLGIHWTTFAAWGLAANVFAAYPHFMATSYRLYHTKENIRQYPLTAIAVPIVIVGAAIACFLWPPLVAPFFVGIWLLWSPYHYAAQSVGVSLLYAQRGGFSISRFERFALASFIFSTFVALMVRAHALFEDPAYWGISYPSFDLPGWAVQLANGWMMLWGAVLVVIAIRWSDRGRRAFPMIVLVPPFAQLIWFVAGASLESFFAFIPLFHSLQYLIIAWAVQLKEVKDEGGIEPSTHFARSATLRWGAILLLGGIVAFMGTPYLIEVSFGYEWLFCLAIVSASINIHHFFVDGVIWKLRNPRVGSVLSADLAEFTGRTR